MSLLLQALQKASKNREDGDIDLSSESPAIADELTLQPASPSPRGYQASAPASSAQAATVVQASAVPGFDPLDYAREHYMLTFVGAALLFAVGYGLYVYMQINKPFQRSAPAPLATAPAPAVAQVAVPPAGSKISGIPGSTSSAGAGTPLAMAAAAPATVLAENDSTSPPASTSRPDTPATGKSPARARTRKNNALPPSTLSESGGASEAEGTELIDASDSIETVEIPASRARSGEISVRRDPAGVTPVSPTLMQAYETLQRGDLEKARKLYEQVLQGDSRNLDALLGMGAISLKDSRIDEATRYYQKVLELDPRNSYAQAALISVVGGADLQASESRLKQLIGRDPSAFLYFSLGNLYAEQAQWPAAQQAYFQAYQMQSDNPDYAFNLAIGLEHIGQNRLALDYYRKALDLSFRKGHANFDQSLVIQRVGQLSTRIEQ